MTKKHYIMISLAVITTALILGGCLVAAFYNRHYLDREGVNLGAFKPTASIKFAAGDDFLISQDITASENNFGKIIIPVSISQTTILDLSVTTKDTEEELRQKTFTLQPDSLAPVQSVTWEFPALNGSANQNYLLEIKKQNNGTITFYAVPPARYDGGELTINGSLLNSQRIVVDWQYYTNNAFLAAWKRFGFMKPGMLGDQLTTVLLFAVLFVLSLLVIGLVVKYILTELVDERL